MKTKLLIMLFIAVVVGGRAPSASADLNSRIDLEMNLPPELAKDNLSPILETRNLVFVDMKIHGLGFLGVFKDYVQSAKEDLHAQNISVALTDFNLDWMKDATRLRGQLLKAYLNGGKKPLVIYGNPVSGPTALLAAMITPNLFTTNIVDRIISFQGVFNGSPYSTGYSNLCSLPFENLNCMFFSNNVAKMSKYLPETVSNVFSNAVQNIDDKTIESMREKVYFVRSSKDPKQMALPFRPGAEELFQGEPSDGVSFTKDQALPEIGHDLGVVNADHWELTASVKIPFSKNQSDFRKAVLRSTLEEMYDK